MTAIVSLCWKCSMPIGDSSLLINGRIYHHECSPYAAESQESDLSAAVGLLEENAVSFWRSGANSAARQIEKFLARVSPKSLDKIAAALSQSLEER